MITCHEIIDADVDADEKVKSNDEAKLKDQTNFIEKKAICKVQNFYVFLAFLLITIALLIAVSIYFYVIKYRAKQLLPFHCKK